MKAAIARWLDQQLADGVVRVELWELATPQQRLAVYDPRGTLVATIASELALCVNAPTLTSASKRVGHALFAYVTDRADDEASALALLRDGDLHCADFASARTEDRVLFMLLRQCEASARLSRFVDDAGIVQLPRRKAPKRPRASGLRVRVRLK